MKEHLNGRKCFVNGEAPKSDWVENFAMLRKNFAKLRPFLEKQRAKIRDSTETFSAELEGKARLLGL